MALKCLQANINHSARAQDLLIQTMVEWQINVAVVSEPYFAPSRDDWVSDRDEVVAIVAPTVAGSPAIERVAKGRGCVLAVVSGVAIIGVYASPNRSLAQFEQTLAEVGALVRQISPNPALVAGDFNAKSAAWGSSVTDARGEVLEEWAVSLGLAVLNNGSESTCVRQQGESIVDITFAVNAVARRTRNWRVETGVETLSDHRYIRFDVFEAPDPPARDVQLGSRRLDGPRWNLGRLDYQLAKEAAIAEAWGVSCDPVVQVDREAEQIGSALSRICDVAMPRAKSHSQRRQLYWWSPELRQLRTACVAARRRYVRCRGRRIRIHNEENLLYAAYRAARQTLQKAIAQAKEAAWEEWLGTLDRDPWGRPYRVVRQRLRPWAPPLTSSLEPQLLERVVDTLFPERGEFVPPAMVPTTRPHETGDQVPPVTEAEFDAAVFKLRTKKTLFVSLVRDMQCPWPDI